MKRYKMLGPFIFVVGLLLSPLSTLADPECSEHGTVVDGKCVCTTPRPGSESLGYVGDLCTTPVYYHAASATETDVSASCGGQPCTTLEPQHTVCFLVELGSFFKSPAHLGLMLVGNGGAVLDLQGLMTSDSQDKAYPNSASHYNFVVSSTAAKPTASLYLDRQTIGDGTNNSVFLCTTNMGSTNASFSLRVAAISCPFHFLPDGSSTALCSSSGPSDVRHSDSTCVSGMCTCVAQWSRPQAPVFEGLGFEDCSASCALLPEGPKVEQHVDAQAPGTWSFFNFTISASDLEDRHVMASLTATADTTSDVELYLKYWQAPGRHVSQYDLRSGPGDFRARAVSADLSASIHLDSSSAIYRPGVWFLGVFVNGDQAVSYDLRLMRSSCLHDCSGSRGTCSKDTGSCNCSKAEYGEADCSSTHDKVELGAGSTYVSEPRAGFLFDYLEVVLNDTLASAPGKSLSLVVEASFSSTSLPAWVTLRPMLLLSGSAISDLSTALMRVVLETAGNKSSVVVEASQVPTGTLYIAIYNPISYPYDIGYSLTVNTAAHCINGCSEHGTCAADGKCSCQDGFTGPDCSVDVSKLQKQACPEGSLREALGIAGGKAYSVCVCSAPDECSYTEVTSQADMIKAFVACSSGYEVTATAPGAIKLSDGRAVNGGGYCKGIRRGTSGGMVFFYCILSIALFCGCVVGGKFGLERYQVWRANQIGGYTDIGGGENNNSLWDAFTGARQNPQHNDSW